MQGGSASGSRDSKPCGQLCNERVEPVIGIPHVVFLEVRGATVRRRRESVRDRSMVDPGQI